MKMTALFLLLSLLLAFTACGTNQTTESDSSAPGTNTEATEGISTERATQETEEDAEVERKFVLVRQTAYNMSNQENSRNEFTYDDNGNEISKLTYTSGVLTQRNDRLYDGQNRCIRSVITDLYKETPESYIYEYEYDESGNLITERMTATNGYLTTNRHEYDSLGRKTKTTSTGNNTTTEYSYPDEKSCIIISKSEISGTPYLQQAKEIYDDQGKLIQRIEYKQNSYDEIEYEHKYQYNEQGKQIKYEIFKDEKLYSETISEYKGDQLYRVTSRIETLWMIEEEYKYDDYGNLIEKRTMLESGMLMLRTVYEYQEIN